MWGVGHPLLQFVLHDGGVRVRGDAVLRCFWCGFSEFFFKPAVFRFSKTVRFAVI